MVFMPPVHWRNYLSHGSVELSSVSWTRLGFMLAFTLVFAALIHDFLAERYVPGMAFNWLLERLAPTGWYQRNLRPVSYTVTYNVEEDHSEDSLIVGSHAQKCAQSDEVLVAKLSCFYTAAALPTILSQLDVVRQSTRHHSPKVHHCSHYLQACLSTLEEIYTLVTQNEAWLTDVAHGWPFCVGNKVVLHLAPLDLKTISLHQGDFFLCVSCEGFDSPWKGSVSTVRRPVHGICCSWLYGRKVHKSRLTCKEFVGIVCNNMDTLENRAQNCQTDDLKSQLKTCLVRTENNVEKLSRQEIVDGQHHGNAELCQTSPTATRRSQCISSNAFESTVQSGEDQEAKIHHSNVCDKSSTVIPRPRGIMDVNFKLLQSGVAVLTGGRDCRGGPVVTMVTKPSIWSSVYVSPKDLAKLLTYYYQVPREHVRQKGFSIAIDGRDASIDMFDVLFDALFFLQANIANAISVVHVIADDSLQSLLLKALKPHYLFKLDLLSSPSLLHKFISPDQLNTEFGGSLAYDHDEWVSFRMRLEPFMDNCTSVGGMLVNAMRKLSQGQTTPASISEANKMIDDQHELMRKLFDEPSLVSLQTEGAAIIQILNKDHSELGRTEDYKDAMSSLHKLYSEVHVSLGQLMELCKSRKDRLEGYVKVQRHKEAASWLTHWLENQGEEILTKHRVLATNLKGIKAQQRDFEKAYFSAMTQVAKGNDLVKEGKSLAVNEELGDIGDAAERLASQMKNFTGQLESTRDRIEATAKSYSLLDKSYEWALEAMKYVASMKMDHCSTPEGLDKLTTSLDLYLEQHPPISQDTFDLMHDLATKLNNERLQEQCQVARTRCQETEQLIRVRQLTLCKAKQQLGNSAEHKSVEKSDEEHLDLDAKPDTTVNSHVVRLRHKKAGDSGIWVPQSSSTPALENLTMRRKSYSGTPSAPMLHRSSSAPSGVVASTEPRQQLSEYEEQLFNDGLISEDISSVISRASGTAITIGDSQSSSADGKNSPDRTGRTSNRNSAPPGCGDSSEGQPQQSSPSGNKAGHRPRRKQMRRANTLLGLSSMPVLETDLQEVERCTRTVSMITGSSESLPSLPEEDEAEGDKSGKTAWSPVPVNTHLLNQKLSGNHYGSMADLRLTEAQVKSRRTLCLIMREMIQTERDYVRSLQYVIENFMPELNRDDVPQSLRGKRNVIFGNIQKIYEFHSQYFLSELETCANYPFNVSNCFLNHEQEFYLYALYNKNKPKSDALMQEFGTKFFRQKQLELGDKMDLASYLLKPVQRMGKYALMLKQIIRECPETDQLYSHLKAAEEMARFQLRHGNDLLAMDSICDCDVNLNEQGRLLRQDEFLVWQGRKKSLRHIFLFEECLILSKTKRHSGHHDTYIYKSSLKTTDLGLTETLADSSPHKFEIWFRKQKHGESYILQAANVDIKTHWTREISRLLWKQAIRNRETRLTEMASMGIGNKPCLDLKQSTNNIKDRFINTPTVANKESDDFARTRNSIAVSSFDHFKNGGKRPHSIISISSSSSSNSSSQSTSLFGPLGLAYDPLDNMWTSRRKSSATTNESGIGTDLPEESPETTSNSQRTVVRSDSGTSVFSNSYTGGGFVATTTCIPGRPLVTDV